MLKYLFNQLTLCEHAARKQLAQDNQRGRLPFLNDRELFLLITAGLSLSLSLSLPFVLSNV